MSADFNPGVIVALTSLRCGAPEGATGVDCADCGWAASAEKKLGLSRTAVKPKSAHEVAEMIRIDERRKQSSQGTPDRDANVLLVGGLVTNDHLPHVRAR